MNSPSKNSRSTRWLKLAKWAIGLLLFYTIAGFFVAPRIVRSIAVNQLSEQLERDVSIEKVKLNPFAFSATIRGLLIKDKDGEPFVSWDEVYVNFQLSSFFGQPWVFKEVSTARPCLRVQMNGDGTFNFSDLIEKFSSGEPSTEPAKPLGLRVDKIQVADAVLSLKREASSLTNIAAPVAVAESGTNTTDAILLLLQSITNAVALAQQSTNAIQAAVLELQVTNCAVKLEDLANPRPVRLVLDEISLAAKHLSNLGHTNLTADLSVRWNTNGFIKTQVSAALAPAAVDIHLLLGNLELRPLDPYLDSMLNVFILGSKLGLDARVRLRATNSELPEVVFTGDWWLNEFSTVDGLLAEDLLKWNSVRISGIEASLNPPVVAIEEILVSDVYTRLIIETNRTINLLAALRMTETNAAPPPDETPAKPLLADETVVSTNLLGDFPLKKLSIALVVITNAHANFSDRAIVPNVNMGIEQINGVISGLSSEEPQRATLNLQARVDGIGPVQITGAINPFRGDETNEIKITISEVDLTPTSSYSAKFAGYRIAKGKLGMTLVYHLRGRELKSENVITLDQFTFGEKVDSPDATKLPVRLAIAVLKDRQGKIILDVPIEGSLDDPQFRLRKVILRTLGNILVKAATSPFAVLGAVFGGRGEEISFQDFAAGSAELTPASREKLDVLAKALYERPGLQLEISGSVDAIADTESLRAMALEKQLRAEKWLSLRRADRATTTPEQVEVTPEERPELIRKLHADALAKGQLALANSANVENPPARVSPAFAPARQDRGATELLRRPTITPAVQQTATPSPTIADPLEAALLNSISVSESDFQALAAQRAKTVREYLLQNGKVEAERLFLAENPGSGARTNGSRVYLQLQ